MEVLKTAIYSRGTASSSLNTSISGRFYYYKPNVQPPTYPFVVFFVVSHPINYYFGASDDSTESLDNVTIQFNVHSNKKNSSTEVNTISGYLTSQFDFCQLSVTGYNSHKMVKTNIYGPFWLQESEEWVSSIEYKITLQKS